MAARYEPYQDYKNTSVNDIGLIPMHWQAMKVNFLFSFGRGLNITKANLQASGIPCVNYGEVHSKYGFELDPARHSLSYVADSYIESSSNSLMRRGDFVFADTSEDIDGVGNFTQLVGEEEVFAGYHTMILRPKTGNHSRFLAYAFDSLECRNQIRQMVKGVKVFSITQEILKNVVLPLPEFEEQRIIADFLDHETFLIDQLIAKQQRLIELLREKTQAVISHAVTKGINPNAPMKDSGLDWRREVPEHWRATKIRWLFKQRKRQGFPELEVLSVYRDFGVIVKSTRDDNNNKTPENLNTYQLVNVSDLVVNKMKAWQGSLGVSKVEGITSPDYVVYAATHDECDQFLHYLFRSSSMPKVYRSISNGIRPSQWRLEPERFERLPVFIPPNSEQKQIVEFIDRELSVIDQMSSQCAKAISLMNERRTALISAAVTGKIDVRNWSPPIQEPDA